MFITKNLNIMTKEKLGKIYRFLTENRQYNKNLQEKYYQDILLSKISKADKLTALLHHVVNTQSQPKVDKITSFFKKINGKINESTSFENFINLLKVQKPILKYNYENLFNVLNDNEGWGEKTSALFVKAIYHIHNNNYDSRLKIWNEAPKTLELDDKLFLPVDAVILHIFNELKIEKANSFSRINTLISNHYKGEEVEVWDDLWFWGFVSQRSDTKGNRLLGWNEGKYWIQLHTDKNEFVIKEIEFKVKKFIDLLNRLSINQ